MVFKTTADHTAFHAGKAARFENGVYVCDEKCGAKRFCPVCGKNEMTRDADMCLECYKKERYGKPLHERISKDELLKLILEYPMTTIGSMYGVSDNAIRKCCKHYGLPYKKKDIREIKM
jgi:hypothetical protein